MKKPSLPALFCTLLAIGAAIGLRTVLGPCIHEDGSFGSCHWAGQALFGLALLMAAESLLAAFLPSARRGLLLALGATAILGLILPGSLIPLCSMATMRCQSTMRPAIAILFGSILLLSLMGLLIERKKPDRRPGTGGGEAREGANP